MVCESIRQSRFLFCTRVISLSWLRQIMYLCTYIDEYGWAAQMLFLLQCTVFVSARFDLNQDCYVYACALAVGKNQSDFIPKYFPQVIVALFLALRPLPHVSGYFWIRNFFFADSKISTSILVCYTHVTQYETTPGKAYLKINLLVKTQLHGRSMEVRCSRLWAPDDTKNGCVADNVHT